LVGGLAQSRGAEIQLTNDPLCAFKLEGAIVPGDGDHLAQLINRSRREELDERTNTLCLTSPGGSYDEGIKISELIYTHGISTVVADGSECYSSCALIFMSGVLPKREIPYRKLSAGGIVGFHAPFLSVRGANYSKEQIEDASQEMRKAILTLVRISSRQTQLGSTDFIKKSLIIRILEKGPEEVFFVKTIAEAARWNIEIFDADKQFPRPNVLDGIKNLCLNFHYSNMDDAVPSTPQNLSVKTERYASKFNKENFRILIRNGRTNDTICEVYPEVLNATGNVEYHACSFDYWSSKSFGDCRDYKTTAIFGNFVPDFFTLAPSTLLKRFH
jgi:hypothetical protein